MLKSKIHLAEVTETQVSYEGSLALDRDLMDAAGLIPYERIWIANVDNGARFDTYLIEAPRKSGTVMVNGAAARLVQKGDRIIVFAYADMEDADARAYRPIKVFPREGNKRFEVKQ
jgi:aspartate 1-decarboxylase